jgi:hypothetical protein
VYNLPPDEQSRTENEPLPSSVRHVDRVLAVSRDGDHVAIRFRSSGVTAGYNPCAAEHLILPNGQQFGPPVWHARPQVGLEFNAWVFNRLLRENCQYNLMSHPMLARLRHQTSVPQPTSDFVQVELWAEGEIQLTARSGLSCTLDRTLRWSWSATERCPTETASQWDRLRVGFRPVRTRAPFDRTIRLSVAQFADGSRIYLDSRGLLHLVSAARDLPEVTLVLSGRNEAEPSGWHSHYGGFGDSRYHLVPHRRDTSKAPRLDNLITAFVRHILCAPSS